MSILVNIFSNALRFTPGGQIFLSATISADEVHCAIKDNGAGISPERINKVFSRFNSTARATGGVGLGLATAKGWVEANGGRIWAESEGAGKGTTVKFTLPLESRHAS